jgi:hypothetical protein
MHRSVKHLRDLFISLGGTQRGALSVLLADF